MYQAPDQATRGGAPQPAGERIALDGHAYTWPQFVQHYGQDARRCWDEAFVFHDRDASQLAVNAHGGAQPAAVIDEELPREDDAYNRDASQLAVNAHGEAQPAAALGDGGPREADEEPQPGAAIDEVTPHEEPIQHKQNDSDASQLAVHAYGEPRATAAMDAGTPHEDAIQHDGAAARGMPHTPRPARECPVNPGVASGAEQTTAQMLALPSVCTFQEMQEMQPVKGVGGKLACVKQRELRQVCLQSGLFEIDLTQSWPQWRQVLRALPPNMQRLIIGDGIVLVKFRLLKGCRDPNYANKWGFR